MVQIFLGLDELDWEHSKMYLKLLKVVGNYSSASPFAMLISLHWFWPYFVDSNLYAKGKRVKKTFYIDTMCTFWWPSHVLVLTIETFKKWWRK